MSTNTVKNYPHFAVHRLNATGLEKAKKIQYAFDTLVAELENYKMDGREWAIVLTKLEEACFFVKKSMAVNLTNQEHGVSAST